MPPPTPTFWLQVPVARSLQITDHFNAPRNYPPAFKHEGIDLAAIDPGGIPVKVLAAQNGIVERVGESPGGYGKYVRIVHPWGIETYKTWYAHLSLILAVEGQFVRAGDVLGIAGTTGNSTGIHLHLTVQHIGRGLIGYSVDDVIDPEPLLRTAPQPPFDLMMLAEDVTIRDGAVIKPGQAFTKTWRVRNLGSRAWLGYKLTFDSGEMMSGPPEVALPETVPGGTANVSLPLVAPMQEGRTLGIWVGKNMQGESFVQALDVDIDVRQPAKRNEMSYVADVTVSDGSVIQAGQDFVKIWRVRNTGDTSWGTGYTLGHFAERRMNGPDSLPLPAAAPGEIVDLALTLRAPTTAGHYRSVWKPRTPDGKFFDFDLYADIVVVQPRPQPRLDEARFVADVTIPDGSVVRPGQKFTKTWRLRNSGNTTWETGYTFAFFSGNRLGATASSAAPKAGPGDEVEISLNFTAPTTPGVYRSTWKLRNRQGRFFEFDMYCLVEVKP